MIKTINIEGMRDALDAFQYRQELHDRLFHTDIYTLSKPRRLVHLVLHQCKYISRLYASIKDAQGSTFQGIERIATDGFIVAMSMANVCNTMMFESLKIEDLTPDAACDRAIRAVGQLAKVVEDIDHMVLNSPLTQISALVRELVVIYLNIAAFQGMDTHQFLDEAEKRLIDVEKKNIFFTRHAKEMDRLLSTRQSAK
ncbi:hypothetical protein RYA05_01560 [Pseudomonas syringae pv. actinidiae]|nr:hypothetical protein [Pseudomonas syringae pv. actinidiae]